MRLTRAGEYAVRCALYLSSCPAGEVVSRKEIAEAMEIPGQFLGKIAQRLARAGIVEIVQGAKGGFRLLRSPDGLSLLDVVEATIGEILLNDCLMNPRICRRSQDCAVNKVWEKARDLLRAVLKEATFKTLMESQSCMTPSLPDCKKGKTIEGKKTTKKKGAHSKTGE